MKNAKALITLLKSKGYKTLIAGGYVRDHLLGVPAKDIDLATEATPSEVIATLYQESIPVLETGLKHGTVTAVLDDSPYEITTLRTDDACFGREAQVSFGATFEADAQRRDFTINALFLDPFTGEIFDYVGGLKDIQDKRLSFVGDPQQRIKEDYLRILRFYRFLAKTNFTPDLASLTACEENLSSLSLVSPERIRQEISQLVISKFAKETLLLYPNFLFQVIPELKDTLDFKQNCEYHYLDVYRHTLEGLPILYSEQDPVLSLAHLLHDIAKPQCFSESEGVAHFYDHQLKGAEIVEGIFERLRFSKKDTERAYFLVKNHMRLHQNPSMKALRRLKRECLEKEVNLNDLYNLHLADVGGMRIRNIYPKAKIEEMENFSVDTFKSPLSGRDIIDIFGIEEGKKIGELKQLLIDLVTSGDLLPDDREKAITYIKFKLTGWEPGEL